ncbi:MAG TPA: chorismate synthase [Bacillota bacterium]|nr:chorismate synthase [Bacillota bacterium]
MLRYLTAGESHGSVLTAIVEGMPAGLQLTEDYINVQLARRQGGYGRGGRMDIERDKVELLSGVRGGYTTGAPITLQVRNKDWENWSKVMSPSPDAQIDERVVTRPRPGHADLSGAIKYEQTDLRNILERASARETAARVAACTVGRRLLEELGIQVAGHVVGIGGAESRATMVTGPVTESASNSRLYLTRELLVQAAAESELYCADKTAEQQMIQLITQAKADGDSLGGIFEVLVTGLPVGLGSHVHWDRRLDGRLAQAVMSIQAIKGVEIGSGFDLAGLPGSQAHDELFYDSTSGFYRETNRAGGLEGGITNGEPLVVRGAMKPIPTLYKPLRSVDYITKQPFAAAIERSDVCAVPAACVVGEAVVSFTVAQAVAEKFGGDTIGEIRRNLLACQER